MNKQQCELYPRVRRTEYYRTPEPRVSIQSRKAEHPNRERESPRNATPVAPHIMPAQTSPMRVQRDSYFS
ncbi:hypothetical protein AWZ03_000254 [Drosophila navojoa]|uniref:Uncharacterized protein n=1 Tax=Drosophila navojoa TaxID=7232 RepID=A0A484BX85_DRONA|nr:uncharacterized protein LOC108649906 isoform X2 [Drosophila navojoa]TDG53439.1 hypothetical protein AWZ03_000254 [Drosophila navojoa]